MDRSPPHRFSELMDLRICLEIPPTSLDQATPTQLDGLTFYVPPSVITIFRWYRNINLLSIDYASRPRLRHRLTLSGLTFLRKPWAFGDNVSHVVYRYLCRQSHFRTVQSSSRSTFTPDGTLPYQGGNPRVAVFRSFGI